MTIPMEASSPHYTITVKRKAQLMDKQISIDIIINNRLAGKIRNGETLAFPVLSDRAELKARIWGNETRLSDIDLEELQHPSFQVETRFNNFIFVTGTILAILSFLLVLRTNQPLYMLIAAPPALYHVYLRFLRKDRYLQIKNMENKSLARHREPPATEAVS